MKLAPILLAAVLSLPAAPSLAATEGDAAFGHMLSLVQVFVRLAGQDDPAAMENVLSGRNLEANRAAAGLFNEITADMAAEHRNKVASIANDVLALAKKDLARPAVGSRNL